MAQMYKVVRKIEGKLMSWFAYPPDMTGLYELNKFAVVYEKDKPTIAPKGTKLFVFDTFKHALNYEIEMSHEDYDVEIWLCEAEGAYAHHTCAVYFREIEKYWNRMLTEYEVFRTPTGTYAADSVTLKSKVEKKRNDSV